MQDGGERSLSLPLPSSSVLGDVASAAASGFQTRSSGSSESRIFVAATLAAIVLAGSAFAYRARPHAVMQSKNDLVPSSVREIQCGDVHDSKPRMIPGGKGKAAEGSLVAAKEIQDAKESKSSRSKDRRRRGKDPLKEVLKNPKKLKSLPTMTPTSTPPLSARSTIATTSTAATILNTANSTAHINSINYNPHSDDETDNSMDPTPEIPSSFDDHTSSSNLSSLQGSISRSKGKQVLKQGFEQEPESAWHDTLPIPGSSDGMISATHNADTSEVSQIDTPHPGQTLHQHPANEPSLTQRRLSQSSHLSPTSGPDHHHQIPNHTYAVPALSSAPSISQKYSSNTRPPSSSSTSPSATPTDNEDSSFGQSFTATGAASLVELDDLTAQTISQARARFLAREDTAGLGLGLALESPPTPPELCSALSSTSSSTEATELSASTMTTNTSVTSGAASISSIGEASGKVLQSPFNSEKSPASSKLNHLSANSSSSSSSSKNKHAPQAQQLPSAAASSSKAKQNMADPWHWDGVSDAARKLDSAENEKEATLKDSGRKPPRKASATSFSAVAGIAASPSPIHGVSKELEIIEETPLSFPTLNPTPASSSRPKPSLEGTGSSVQQPSTPRRAPTPRRPQTPSYHSNNNSNCSTPPPPSSASSSSSHQATSVLPPPNGMPALSTQTQLASMRGALEASRLREEKNKAEMERVTKEMERLQWENANWKRGEMELRKQMAYLMHQVHSYAAMFAAVSPQFNLHLQQQMQMRNQHAQNLNISISNGAAATESGSTLVPSDISTSISTLDGAQPSLSSSPPPHATQGWTQSQDTSIQSPFTAVPSSTPVATSGGSASSSASPQSVTSSGPHPLQLSLLHALQTNGHASLVSPMSAGPVNPNPSQFFQYPFPQQIPGQHFTPHSMAHLQQTVLPFQHVSSPIQSSPHLPAFLNNTSAANGRISVNASPSLPSFGDGAFGLHHFHPQVSASTPLNGPSSSGSLSPELNGSPNTMSGKRQSRSRNQRPNGNGRAAWEDTGNGWMGTNGTSRPNEGREGTEGQDQQDGADSEGGFNELLADAILKRPGSIRIRSPKKGKSAEDERDTISESERMTEFAFPSLSDMGNVLYRSGTRNVTEEYPTPSPSTLPSPSADAALSSLSASPKKTGISVVSEPLDKSTDLEVSDASGEIRIPEDISVGFDSPDSDKTPRKEPTEAQIAHALIQESATKLLTPKDLLYETDHHTSPS